MRIGRLDEVGGFRFAAPKDLGEAVQQATSDKFKINPPTGGWKKLEFVEQKDNTLTIRIAGIERKILDEQDIEMIGKELFHLSDELQKPENLVDGKPPVLRLDFSNLTYMSSAALCKLIILNRKQTSGGSEFELENIPPKIYGVFETTKLNKLFKIINPPTALPKPEEYSPRWGNGSGRGNLY